MKREFRALLRRATWAPLPAPREPHATVAHPVAEAFVETHGYRVRFLRLSNGAAIVDPRQITEISGA